MRRLTLVEILSSLLEAGNYVRYARLDPIGLEYLGAVTQQKGYDVTILQEGSGPPELIAERIQNHNPDVVGFSTLAYDFDISKEVARILKRKNPNVQIIFGGAHASSCPEIVKDKSIDYVVLGEGEETFIELLDALETGKDLSCVKGIAYFDHEFHLNEGHERIDNLDGLPYPIRNKELISQCKISGLIYPPATNQCCPCQITYSRGCSHNCKFCASVKTWGRKVSWRSASNVVDEIISLQNKFGTNLLLFTDLTFNLNRTRVFELCDEILNRKVKIHWLVMCRPEQIDKELLIKMRDAGCSKISYGIESLSAETLGRIKPDMKKVLPTIESTLALTNDSGIITKAYLIIGYPWETKESLMNMGRMLNKLPIDELRMSFLTPFPGTLLYKEFKDDGYILTDDLRRYTSEESIVKTEGLSPDELLNFRARIFREFYQSKEYESRMNKKITKFPHLKKSYDELFGFLHSKGIITTQ